MGYMFRLLSSHLQALKMYIHPYKCLLNCGIPNAYRIRCILYRNI